MSIASMTGYARSQGNAGGWLWTWEVKTLNARGLDIRLRLPPGFDAIENDLRADIAKALHRGTCHAGLTVTRPTQAPAVRLNRPVLDGLIAALADIPVGPKLRRASLDGLLAIRGVIDIGEPDTGDAGRAAAGAAIRSGLAEALADLLAARRSEGEALRAILVGRLARIGMLGEMAEDTPGRMPEAVRARLAKQIETLGGAPGLDEGRLHAEAVLLAAKSDIREELDRLIAHVSSASSMLAKGGAVGRRLDFLAQELGRESNTLCAKSNDAALTAIGLDLKVEVEQFREQVQNIE